MCPSSWTAKTLQTQAFVSKRLQTVVQEPKLSDLSLRPVKPVTSLLQTKAEPAQKPRQSQTKILCSIREKQPELTAPVADSPLHNCCSTAPAEEYQHDYSCVPTQS